jgi:hypothetical protein
MTNADQKLGKKMQCIAPIRPEGRNVVIPVACGRCIPCRIRKRSEWITRLLLEARCHQTSVFLTLTYDDDHLPGRADFPGGNLRKKDAQTFQKLLRQEIARYEKSNGNFYSEPTRIRFYTVGEYGEQSQRAHLHAIVFGLPYEYDFLVKKAWPNGYTYARPFLRERAQYIAGYTTKKLACDERLLDGRNPVFQLSSRRPGLGKEYSKLIAQSLVKARNHRPIIHDGFIRIDGRLEKMPECLINEIDRECFRRTGEYKTYTARSPEELFDVGAILDRRRISELRVKQLERKQKAAYQRMKDKHGEGT